MEYIKWNLTKSMIGRSETNRKVKILKLRVKPSVFSTFLYDVEIIMVELKIAILNFILEIFDE